LVEDCDSCETGRGDVKGPVRYLSDILAGKRHVEIESRLLNYSLGTTTALTGAGVVAYAVLLQGMQLSVDLSLIFLAIICSVTTLFAYHHVMHYGKNMSCANGMMAGMTLGMISGFMAGALIGATNGMFIGSVGGMMIGISLGGNLGRCTGVMGAMEGIMAGIMAGIMGAMTSVMMINDNLVAFLFLLFGICTFVLGGLSYMMYREAGITPLAKPVGFGRFLAISMVFSIALVVLMVYGPKGPITYP